MARKSKRKPVRISFTLRIDMENLEHLRKIASYWNESVTDLVNEAITEWLGRYREEEAADKKQLDIEDAIKGK